jgi:hypothetical protein
VLIVCWAQMVSRDTTVPLILGAPFVSSNSMALGQAGLGLGFMTARTK